MSEIGTKFENSHGIWRRIQGFETFDQEEYNRVSRDTN